MKPTPLDTKSTADYAGLSESSLEKARVNGTGPKYLKIGRLVRYRVEDIDEWLASRIVRSTSEATVPLNAVSAAA